MLAGAVASRAAIHPADARLEAPIRWAAEELLESFVFQALLVARLYATFPLTCPHCGKEMRLVAFITEKAPVPRLLNNIGEPAMPPRIVPARGPPPWEGNESRAFFIDEDKVSRRHSRPTATGARIPRSA